MLEAMRIAHRARMAHHAFLLPQQQNVQPSQRRNEQRERHEIEDEIGEAEAFGEGADADRHEIGHREGPPMICARAGERRDRRHHAGKLRRRQDGQDRRAEQRGDLGVA